MDTRIQTSFIPKKPVDGSPSAKATGGIFYFLGTLIFVISIIASVVVFGYQKYLEGNISQMENQLSIARQELEPELIQELARADRRFNAAEEIINGHTMLSELFDMLQKLTLQNIAFSSFTFSHDTKGFHFSLNGEGRSYATVAYQAKIFSEEPYFKNTQFSELDLNDSGNVIFVVKSDLDQKAVSYGEFIKKMTGGTPLTTVETGSSQALLDNASSSPATTTPSSATSTTP